MIPRDESDEHSAVLELRGGATHTQHLQSVSICQIVLQRQVVWSHHCLQQRCSPCTRGSLLHSCATLSFTSLIRYAAFKKWDFETLSINESELGGYKVYIHQLYNNVYMYLHVCIYKYTCISLLLSMISFERFLSLYSACKCKSHRCGCVW